MMVRMNILSRHCSLKFNRGIVSEHLTHTDSFIWFLKSCKNFFKLHISIS
jgi:hypothetical protein